MITRTIKTFVAFLGLLVVAAIPLRAQPVADLTLNYFARENVNRTDNDIIQALGGLTWMGSDGGWRLTVGAGIRNEFFSGGTPYDAEVGLLKYWNRGQGQRGVGFTLRNAEGEGVALDLAGFATHERQNWGLRGLVGVQGLTGTGSFAGARNIGFFALGEASVYPVENIALRTALTLDDVDILATVAFEMKVPRVPISIGMEWTASLDNYRQDLFYNDLTYQIRYVHKFGSVRQRERDRPIRALNRPVNPL